MGFGLPSFTLIVSGLFLAYIGHSCWTMYKLFYPAPCPPTNRCIPPYTLRRPRLELRVYSSLRRELVGQAAGTLLWHNDTFNMHEAVQKNINVSLPYETRNNGSLYIHVIVTPYGQQPFKSSRTMKASTLITTHALPQAQTFNLMGDKQEKTSEKTKGKADLPITHWRSKLKISVMNEELIIDSRNIPHEIFKYLRLSQEGEYLPIVYVDELSYRVKDLVALNVSSETQALEINYAPISVGKLRMWLNIAESMKMLEKLGFTEKDTDEVKGIFADTDLKFLLLTFMVAALHLLFDFLAFKNDVSYWKKRDTMIGLSTRVVVWRCVSTIIIFLYLHNEETSLLVLIPAGIGTLIEVWKVKKAFKVKLKWSGIKPSLEFGASSAQEKETEQFDSQAMKYLSYVMYPLCVAGAIYSLIYTPHKSWYSWCVQSLVNGVYAFGFLFMLPQLFVNYKLKSVAHLPWRAFMYKAFNTFIDDVFAFIITMPTAHRLACFRDDIIFIIYLYQRWLYPVDHTRVNEYGQSFKKEETVEDKKTK